MVSRRDCLGAAPLVLGAAPLLASCGTGVPIKDYETVAACTWRLGNLQGFDRDTLPPERRPLEAVIV